MPVTRQQLKEIMRRLKAADIERLLAPLNQALDEFDINTPKRRATFLAQIAHESGELRYMEEIWGPTKAQLKYEGRKDLGNTEAGDGKRYKGRGVIQLTGRANYRDYGRMLGLDLEGNPTLAADANVAFRIAGAFWKSKGLNRLADVGEFAEITKRINGGYNGMGSRQKYYERAKKAFATPDEGPQLQLSSDEVRDDGTQTSEISGAVSEPEAKEVKMTTMSSSSKRLTIGLVGTAIVGFLKEAWQTSREQVIDASQYALAHLPITVLIIGLALLGVWIYNTASKRRDERLRQIVEITSNKSKNDVVIT